MTVALAKNSIDLGIVVQEGGAALKFYRDTLGFSQLSDLPMPGGGTMHRLLCGDSLLKIIVPDDAPPAVAPPGGIQGASGYRYWTVYVSNLGEIMQACREGGYTIAIEEVELRPGIRIGIVEDPDGNWVEFVNSKPS
ncbi:MAG: VOC family protein [Deltaproteobacteria bacterium]|nr:VOC family protein [Deltaproteobacteria bacterium]